VSRGFTAFLLIGVTILPTSLYAKEPLPLLNPIPTPQVKTVYKISKDTPLKRHEFPIEKGTLSSKLFEEDLVLDEGQEKIKYLSELDRKKDLQKKKPIKVAKKTIKLKPSKVKLASNKKKKATTTKVAKVNYPKGTIILLDKTIIRPKQQMAKVINKKPIKAKITKVALTKNTKIIKIPKVKISYLADESEIVGSARKKLLRFIRKLRKQSNGKVKIITASIPLPLQEEQTLAQTRVKYIKAFMREQGVNPEKYNFSSEHKKSKGKKQYLVMEYVS
jgi:hypothetical protein